jgi:hypothetical protein
MELATLDGFIEYLLASGNGRQETKFSVFNNKDRGDKVVERNIEGSWHLIRSIIPKSMQSRVSRMVLALLMEFTS